VVIKSRTMLLTLLGLGLAITSSVVEQRVREGRWNKHDNNKFRQLIVDGVINPRKESKEDIERVRALYWPEKAYRNFAANYRRIVKVWLLHAGAGKCIYYSYYSLLQRFFLTPWLQMFYRLRSNSCRSSSSGSTGTY